MLTVTYMVGGVHVHGAGYDIRVRSFLAALYIVSTSGLEVKVEYSNQPIGAVAV
jgi:hypothetical protein